MADTAVPQVAAQGVIGQRGEGQEITLNVDGMHCGSCIRRVTQAIHGAGPFGVTEVRLGAARFKAPDGTESTAADLAITALGKAGFQARVDE